MLKLKMLVKEIKEILNKWKTYHMLYDGTFSIKMMPFLSKVIYKFKAISIKIPGRLFIKIDRFILKLTWKDIIPKVTKTIIKKKNKMGGITLLDFKGVRYGYSNKDCVVLGER